MEAQAINNDVNKVMRSDFSKDLIFGTASSAYQYEGATKEDGRGPSIWDTFTQRTPGKVKDGANGNMAVDSYHLYKILKKLGLDAYRFSISWPRVLPGGKLSGGVNKEGIEYYNNLINELLANGIEPYVTLFHWDLPQALEDAYGGFLSSPQALEDAYGGFLSSQIVTLLLGIGDRVKNWITLNEPWTFSLGGGATSSENVSGTNTIAPSRCSPFQQHSCSSGNPGTEPYLVTHHQLLAHAASIELYKQKFQGGSDWLYIYPEGIRKLLIHIKKMYNVPLIYITENGVDEVNNTSLTLSEARIDKMRIEYHQDQLFNIKKAIE
ncbi:hypothetical protein LguiA_019164 [Lonicera macranthoides]